MLDLHVPKIIAYFIECAVSFLYPSSFRIYSIRKTPIVDGVVVVVFSCMFDMFPVRANYLLLI